MTRNRALVPLFVLALVLSVGGPLSGQARVGVKGGVALANMYGDAVGNVDLRNGFTGGIFIDAAVTPVFSIQPEALYVQKGAIERGLIDTGGGVTLAEGTWEYDYVDVAALLKLRFGSGSARIAIYGGPVYSILVSANAVGEGQELDIKDLTKSNDLGGAFGVAVEFTSGFLLDVRYSAGTIAFDEPPLDLVYARQHNVISAMVGIAAGG